MEIGNFNFMPSPREWDFGSVQLYGSATLHWMLTGC